GDARFRTPRDPAARSCCRCVHETTARPSGSSRPDRSTRRTYLPIPTVAARRDRHRVVPSGPCVPILTYNLPAGTLSPLAVTTNYLRSYAGRSSRSFRCDGCRGTVRRYGRSVRTSILHPPTSLCLGGRRDQRP